MDFYNRGKIFNIINNYYFYIFIDNTTCQRDMFLLKIKIEIKLKLSYWIKKMKKQSDKKIKFARFDKNYKFFEIINKYY